MAELDYSPATETWSKRVAKREACSWVASRIRHMLADGSYSDVGEHNEERFGVALDELAMELERRAGER